MCIQGQGHCLTLAKNNSHIEIKTLNCMANRSQILYDAPLERGSKIIYFYKLSSLHDKDGGHANIW